jgi:RsiW-degrading membrane proteinase PrsW (M82 family)
MNPRYLNRVISAIGLGVIFTTLVSVIAAIDSKPTVVLSLLLGIGSPIYWWRHFHCLEDSYWMTNIEIIAPFFFYGSLIGYLAIRLPSVSFSYAKWVAKCFFVVAFLVYLSINLLPGAASCASS